MPELSRRSARPSKRDRGTGDAGSGDAEPDRIKAELIKADVLALAAEAEAEAAEAEAEAARARAALLDHLDPTDTEVSTDTGEPPVAVWEPSADDLTASLAAALEPHVARGEATRIGAQLLQLEGNPRIRRATVTDRQGIPVASVRLAPRRKRWRPATARRLAPSAIFQIARGWR